MSEQRGEHPQAERIRGFSWKQLREAAAWAGHERARVSFAPGSVAMESACSWMQALGAERRRRQCSDCFCRENDHEYYHCSECARRLQREEGEE